MKNKKSLILGKYEEYEMKGVLLNRKEISFSLINAFIFFQPLVIL